MPDRITGGLILPDYAESMIQGLESYNKQKLFEQEQAEYTRALAQRDNTDRAQQQFTSGNYEAARQTAREGNNWATFHGLGEEHQKQVAAQIGALGSLAYDLKGLPVEQRASVFNSRRGQLKALGMTDADLDGAVANLGDDAYLSGYIGAGQSLADKIKHQEKIDDDNRTFVREQMKPITAADGAVLQRNATGGYDTLYTPGTKPMQQFITDPITGQVQYVSVPGTPGVSSGGSAGGVGSKFVFGDQQKQVASTLSNLGIPPNAVAGYLGNFHVEAGYNGATGDGGSAGGIAQWRKERRDKFVQMFGVDPSKATMEQQAQYVAWELKNPQAAGMTVAQRDAILNAKSPEEAAELIDRHYERSSGVHRGQRISAAGQAAQALGFRGASQQSQPQQQTTGGITSTVVTPGRQPVTNTEEIIDGQRYNVSVDARTGKKDYQAIGSKSEKPVDQKTRAAAASRYNTVNRAEAIINRMQVLEKSGNLTTGWFGGGISTRGKTQLFTTAEDAEYDQLAGELAGMKSGIVKVPGSGSTSDYDAKIANMPLPSRDMSEAARRSAYGQVSALNQDEMYVLKDTYGLTPTGPRGHVGGGARSNNQQQSQTKVLNGITYKKVPGGWQKQ